jgi:hypothetical protein
MKIYNMVKLDMDTGEILEEDSFEYDGPLALAVDGPSGADGGPDGDVMTNDIGEEEEDSDRTDSSSSTDSTESTDSSSETDSDDEDDKDKEKDSEKQEENEEKEEESIHDLHSSKNKTAKDFMERERSAEEKKKCEDVQEKNESQEKSDELKKEIEREISLVKYTGYKSSNLEKLIDEYRTEFMRPIVTGYNHITNVLKSHWVYSTDLKARGEEVARMMSSEYHQKQFESFAWAATWSPTSWFLDDSDLKGMGGVLNNSPANRYAAGTIAAAIAAEPIYELVTSPGGPNEDPLDIGGSFTYMKNLNSPHDPPGSRFKRPSSLPKRSGIYK